MKTSNALKHIEKVKKRPIIPTTPFVILPFLQKSPNTEEQPAHPSCTFDMKTFYNEAAEHLCKKNDLGAYVKAMRYYKRAREL